MVYYSTIETIVKSLIECNDMGQSPYCYEILSENFTRYLSQLPSGVCGTVTFYETRNFRGSHTYYTIKKKICGMIRYGVFIPWNNKDENTKKEGFDMYIHVNEMYY